MRSLMMMIVSVAMLSSMLGCQRSWTHGVCDCDMDNHCFTRTPWPIARAAVMAPGEAIPAPATKLPDGKKL